MKTNKFADLIKFGLKPNTLLRLSESDLGQLHKSLIKKNKKINANEAQVTTKSTTEKVVTALKPGDVIPTNKAGSIKVIDSNTLELNNSEVKESGKRTKNNPFAICTAELGKKFGTTKRSQWTPSQEKKYEACKAEVGESLKEGKNYFDIILERKIVSLLETNLSPKITKGDLVRLLEAKKKQIKKPIGKIASFGVKTENKESDTKTKPKTKPGTLNLKHLQLPNLELKLHREKNHMTLLNLLQVNNQNQKLEENYQAG